MHAVNLAFDLLRCGCQSNEAVADPLWWGRSNGEGEFRAGSSGRDVDALDTAVERGSDQLDALR